MSPREPLKPGDRVRCYGNTTTGDGTFYGEVGVVDEIHLPLVRVNVCEKRRCYHIKQLRKLKPARKPREWTMYDHKGFGLRVEQTYRDVFDAVISEGKPITVVEKLARKGEK